MPEGVVLTAVGDAEAIEIDGRLDEAAWGTVEPVTDLLRYTPNRGGPPPGHTEVRFLQDEKNLYIGIRVWDTGYPIRARVSPREAINADDQVGIYLDPFHKGQGGYIFYLNPLGVQQDLLVNGDAFSFFWDTVFRTKGIVVGGGYTIEMALPWRSVKYPRTPGPQTWGIILTRKVPHEGAKYAFPEIERQHPRLFSQAAPLEGVRPAPRGSGIELDPGVTLAQQWSRDAPDAPLAWSGVDPWYEAVRPSLDTRFGITPNIGFAAALNPDFSQVEGDVTHIDLNQRFAFDYPEKRPFFLDSAGAFSDPAETLYTRSINEPLYGVKVSGREGAVEVGALNALDRTPGPSFHEQGADGFSDADVDGRWAENTLVRLKHDVRRTGGIGVTFADKRVIRTAERPGSAGEYSALGADLTVPIQGRWIAGVANEHSSTGLAGERQWGMSTSGRLRLGDPNAEHGFGDGTSLDASVTHETEGYRQEMGYHPQSGRIAATGVIEHAFELDRGLDAVVPALSFEAIEERNGDFARGVEGASRFVVGPVGFAAEGAWTQEREQDVTVNGGYAELVQEGDLAAWLSTEASVQAGRRLDYDRLAPADFQTAEVVVALRPTAGTRFDLSALGARQVGDGVAAVGDGVAGDGVELADRLRAKATWQVTRPLGIRAIVEHTDGTDLSARLGSSLLVTWLLHPGTAVYAGYLETTDLEGAPATLERTVFAKVNVLFRP